MSEKKTSTPKEIPLHEVVLQIMYEANKERPAELTVSDVYQKISDGKISENNVSDVLKWLVVQKQVECTSGKFFSLDRFELIEQRLKDAAKNGEKLNLVTEDNPLHEVILSLMFEANKNTPAKLTLDDVYWMISDPKVHKSLVGDVLKWLLNQGRVEYLAGKYSLDAIEFQTKVSTSKPKPKAKKPKKKPKPVVKEEIKEPENSEEPVEEKPKIVIPVVPEKKEPAVETPDAEEKVAAIPPRPKPKKFFEELQPKEVVKVPFGQKLRIPLLIVAIICVIYTFYVLFSLSSSISSTNSSSSEEVQKEIVATQTKLTEISEKGSSSTSDIEFLQEKVQSLQEMTQKTSIGNQKSSKDGTTKSLLVRLIGVLCVTFAIVSFLIFSRKEGFPTKKK